MLDRKSQSWFYPEPTGDPGRDRNARTLQFACLLFALAVGTVALLNTIAREPVAVPILGMSAAGLVAAAAMNWAGKSTWAARTTILALLLTAILLVLQARDGFRSHAMLVFPGLLLISVMLLDRASYVITVCVVLLAVAALGIAEIHGIARAAPLVRTPTSYGSVFFVDLTLLVFSVAGIRIARDTQANVSDLRTGIHQLSAANSGLTASTEALRQSELKYRRLHESITDAVATVDMAGHILEFNRAFETMLGYTGEELRRLTYQEITPERWRAFEARIIAEQILPTGCSELYQKEYRRRDGTVFPVELRTYLLRDEQNRPAGMWALIRDITERKRAEEALRESERRFRSLFDSSLDAVFLTNTQGAIESANPAACAMLGMTEQEICNAGHDGLIVDDERLRAGLETRKLTGRVQPELTFIRKDGTKFEGDVSSVVLAEEGQAFVIVRDITERKRAQEVLQASEKKFATLFRSCPVSITVSDLNDNDRFLEVNEAFERYTGHRREEVIGRTYPPDWLWADPREYADAVSLFTDGGTLRNFEFRFRRTTGEIRTGILSAELIHINGKPCVLATTLDITERKQAEAALRESEARLKHAQRLARIASWEQDPQTGAMNWPEEAFRVFGPPVGAPQDFASLLSYAHPRDRQKIVEADSKTRSGVEPVEVEHRILLPDGQVRFARSIAQAIRDERGVPLRLIGATQDITDQVLTLELLRDSERRLRIAERLAHVGHWEWDLKSNRVSCSEEILWILGKPEGFSPDLEGACQLVAAQDRTRAEQWIRDCLAARKGRSIQVLVTRSDGELRALHLISEVVVDEEGRPVRMLGSCQDVTDSRRALEEAFARQKLESLGTLAGGIAHDFNNLLGAVLAQAELAGVELTAGASPAEQLQEIRHVAIRGSEIVRQLMIYAGKETDVLEPVDVSKVVGDMLRLLTATISKNAAMVTELAENLPAVKARPAQLRQILMNLVVNASEAIKDRDGVIRVATGWVAVGRDHAGAVPEGLAEGNYVQLEVSDTGLGMSQETQAKVFDPFFTTKSAGRGLGLAVVQGIVRSLNGAIRVVSESGSGTTFRILLPCAEGAAGSLGEVVAVVDQAARSAPEATVLVVEDEAPLRLAVRKMLGKAGFEVLEAGDGSEAIELLRGRVGNIDVLLLDMTIPGAPSHEVLAEAVQSRPDLKVILTSAYSEEMVKAALNAPQVHGFVRKPFQFADLVRTIRNVMS
jgi:two-component system cell cycle sensor histidine kinase/response regulator CckA